MTDSANIAATTTAVSSSSTGPTGGMGVPSDAAPAKAEPSPQAAVTGGAAGATAGGNGKAAPSAVAEAGAGGTTGAAAGAARAKSAKAAKPQAANWLNSPEGQRKKSSVPAGLWQRCASCSEMIFRIQMEANLHVCPLCGHHYRVGAVTRIEQLCDPGSFEAQDEDMVSLDPLGFKDLKDYPSRIKEEQKRTGRPDGAIWGYGFIKGRRVVLCVLDLTFMMGSMGSVVGEKVCRAIEAAIERDLPLVIVSASGGARMQESTLSLMQLVKTSAALARLSEQGGLFISVIADPTTGGVTASFAMLGDVILAEPGALIGFAGPRVIMQTIRQELPANFQRSELLKKLGFVDRIVPRAELRSEISRIIDYCGK